MPFWLNLTIYISPIFAIMLFMELTKALTAKPRTYLLYVGMVCVGFFMASIFFKALAPRIAKEIPARQSPPQTEPPEELPGVSAPPEAEVVAPEEIQTILPPTLSLNGIFSSRDGNYALINNQVLKVGDSIEGATIKWIGATEVELEFGGSAFKLSTTE